MTASSFDTIVLAIQIALLFAIGVQYRRRLQGGEDFVLGRRRLNMPYSGAMLAMNSVPVWWLLTLIGTAFATGVAAIWLAMALFGGVVIGGWYLAPRLRALTNLQQRGTFSELLVGDAGERMRNLLLRSTLLIITVTLIVASVAQLQLAAQFLTAQFGLAPVTVIVGAGVAICVAILFAGVWTMAVVDVWQIVIGFVVLSVAALALCVGIARAPDVEIVLLRGDWFADHHGLLVVSFTVGIAFVAGDIVGQAPLLARYMACSSDEELKRARNYSLLWAAIALPLSLLIGWSARALSDSSLPSMAALTNALSVVLSPHVVAALLLLTFGIATAAIGNGLHTIASHLANDLRRGGTLISLVHCRLWLVLTVLAAVIVAGGVPIASARINFERMLFCWHALGAAFGPLLIVRLSGKRVRAGSSLGSIWSGFLLTLVFYLMPDTPGELLERGLPFAAALGIALSGGERRRNPDRADRGERTVHDRLPI
jgi:sodium/proline symporter